MALMEGRLSACGRRARQAAPLRADVARSTCMDAWGVGAIRQAMATSLGGFGWRRAEAAGMLTIGVDV